MHVIGAGTAYDVYGARRRGGGELEERALREGALPLRARIEELAKSTPSPFIWDLEGKTWGANPEQWSQVTRWARAAAPEKLQGHYAVFPVRLFHQTPDEINSRNLERLAVVDEVDFFVPSFYQFYEKNHDSRGSWKYMVLQAEIAVKRHGKGKPVYPMMLEYFHPRAHETLALKEIPEAQLEEMFRFVLDRFDGLCMWGGRNSAETRETAYRARGFDEAGPVDWDKANMDESALARVLTRILPEYRGPFTE